MKMTIGRDATGRAFLRELVAEMEQRAPYASALITETRGLSVYSSTRMDRVNESGPQSGAVFTAWTGEAFEEEATTDLSRDGLARAARDLISRIDVRSGARSIDPGTPASGEFSTPCLIDPADVGVMDKLENCRELRHRLQNMDARVVDASCRYSEEHTGTAFVSRTRDLSQDIVSIMFGPMIVFSEGSSTRYDTLMSAGTGGYELAEVDGAELEALGARIPHLLQAERIAPGVYDIVASPMAAGLIAHEAFGHGVETDMFLKGRARSRDYLGQPVGSAQVDLFDDPTWPAGPGTLYFDDEGQNASRTCVLDRGVFTNGLTDMNAAMRLKIPRTANGRRQGTNKAYARMTNTYFGPGPDSVADMIAGIDRGVYLGQIESGMEDPKGWGVQCVILWGRAIEEGRLTDRYYTQVGLTGYVPDLLGSVSMVGSDVRLFGGTCGKGYKEWVRVGMGGPHMKMKARLG